MKMYEYIPYPKWITHEGKKTLVNDEYEHQDLIGDEAYEEFLNPKPALVKEPAKQIKQDTNLLTGKTGTAKKDTKATSNTITTGNTSNNVLLTD